MFSYVMINFLCEDINTPTKIADSDRREDGHTTATP